MTRYEQGFLTKCAEAGLSEEQSVMLLKQAWPKLNLKFKLPSVRSWFRREPKPLDLGTVSEKTVENALHDPRTVRSHVAKDGTPLMDSDFEQALRYAGGTSPETAAQAAEMASRADAIGAMPPESFLPHGSAKVTGQELKNIALANAEENLAAFVRNHAWVSPRMRIGTSGGGTVRPAK